MWILVAAGMFICGLGVLARQDAIETLGVAAMAAGAALLVAEHSAGWRR